jgi:hypothetical protein
MKNYTELSLGNLKETSKNWNGDTKDLLLFIGGSGDMCGGSARLVHVVLHGKNSIYETGSISIKGVASAMYNIARGANGETCQVVCYYKDKTDFRDIHNTKPTYKATIDGSCGGGEEAICSILRAEKDWIVS